ncbi:hypothetical protein [Ruminococcus flavefaciens]|uniref:DUF5640 domain-containing protein n=1 Tax=Ruminococcus flavefaciens 007c TaxID=1341157 RepID=W7UDA8_RUMFL|nr:hypothetical protein [Ruminococcus flavefaciens]EWM53076.1 hypothetical protein RF007C_15810 [Ruminococcus flavefaciens 007c]
MKKARFIGVLMAAVMAIVPFAGNAKTSFNSINANADYWLEIPQGTGTWNVYHNGYGKIVSYEPDYAWNYGAYINTGNNGGITWYDSDKRKNFSGYHYCLSIYNSKEKAWYDFKFYNGRLTLEKDFKPKGAKDYTTITLWSFNTGGDMIGFQKDGNMVAYTRSGKPVAHTNTYNTHMTTDQGFKYEYSLTTDGRFRIIRIYPGSGKRETIWDSSKNTMYRI